MDENAPSLANPKVHAVRLYQGQLHATDEKADDSTPQHDQLW